MPRLCSCFPTALRRSWGMTLRLEDLDPDWVGLLYPDGVIDRRAAMLSLLLGYRI